MTFSDPAPEAEEQRFRRVLTGAPLPPAPDLTARLRRRLRRRRALRLVAAAAAVLLLALLQLRWRDRPAARAPEPVETPAAFVWTPPVETLDVLARDREALEQALEQLGREK